MPGHPRPTRSLGCEGATAETIGGTRNSGGPGHMAGPASMSRMSSLPTLGPRGEGWVVAQLVLFGLIVLAGTLGPAWDGAARTATSIVGAFAIATGGLLAVKGVLDLRENLTPLPHPRSDNRLVERGAYRYVRHPIYGGLILAAGGWGLWTASPAALALTLVLLGFFDLKSRREEHWLEARHPDYVDYRRRTKRFFPLIY